MVYYLGIEAVRLRCLICAVVAQLDRVLDSDSKGQRFESSRPHQKQCPLGRCFFLFGKGA